ncbi:MAG TPA: ParA family protein [Candidatus Binataceae bacterium]|nr:ParA family protein [Candidatus Binataceae bacterium]
MSKKVTVIGVIGQKGGGGKTTIAINLAVAAARQKLAAVIIDLDQQTNSAKWRRRRSDNVAVVPTTAGRIQATIQTAVTHSAEFIVIDSPGHNDSAATEAVRASDLVILPVEPQMFHFDTMPAMRDIVRIGGDKPTWLVVNKLHPSASALAERLKKIIFDTYSVPVCPVHLSRFDIYATSADVGLTPEEQDSGSRAAQEIRALYKFINQQVNKLRSPHVQKNDGLAASA